MTQRETIGLAKMAEVEKKLREAGYGEQIDAGDIWLNWSGEIVLSRVMRSKATAIELSQITGARRQGLSLEVYIKFPKMARRYRYI